MSVHIQQVEPPAMLISEPLNPLIGTSEPRATDRLTAH
jgi:hypothetical protein